MLKKSSFSFILLMILSNKLNKIVVKSLNLSTRNGSSEINQNNIMKRLFVPEHQSNWSVPFRNYKETVPFFDSERLKGKYYADPEIDEPSFAPKWNQMDGNINRQSLIAEYKIQEKYPLNPSGRCGLRGRGTLGRWGPNHAADPVVTRWKRNLNGSIVMNPYTNKKILQVIVIQRKDNGLWALPGGMQEPGEHITVTVKREFIEETLNNNLNENVSRIIDELFSKGLKIYSGYVADPRNTDNAWTETTAYNIHDEIGEYLEMLCLSAGDDAGTVKWIDVEQAMDVNGSHKMIIQLVSNRLDSHWLCLMASQFLRKVVFFYAYVNFCVISANLINVIEIMKPGLYKHVNCRNTKYLNSFVERLFIPDELIDWQENFPNYDTKVPFYEAPGIHGKPWSDLSIDNPNFKPKWNQLDGNVNRQSFIGEYQINERNFPINPFGRTGLCGRGLLGRWGPNHAADPIVTRWKRDRLTGAEVFDEETKKKILQMIVIQRKDNNMWAIPGGMVDPGEKVSTTLKREFMEEALNNEELLEGLTEFFESHGTPIYSGYVDDPRNTDNAWMETTAYNFHDASGKYLSDIKLTAGDDAGNVQWIDIDKQINLYASHRLIVQQVIMKLDANW